MSDVMQHLTLRVGGVPEHFNFIWHRREASSRWEAAGIDVCWRDFPGGTGAMVAALVSGEIDVALLLTEGAVAAAAARQANFRIVSSFVETPLCWGVHVHRDHAAREVGDLAAAVFAISRRGSGSHLMAAVLADARGWPVDEQRLELVGDLEGARQALAAGRADAFLWEKYTSKPLVDSGEWRRIGELPTPWPAFVVVASEQLIGSHPERLVELLAGVRDALGAVDAEDAVSFIAHRYRLGEADVRAWRAQTRWRVAPLAAEEVLGPVADTLVRAGILERVPDVASLCARLRPAPRD